jgi:hypothetical protein
MKETEINVAIANLCGTMPIPSGGIVHLKLDIPNYCGSLDAMYMAEAVIINLSDPSNNLWAEYCDTLISILFPESDTNKAELSDLGYALLAIHSSAHKRAEAFLRVHGKWID